MDKPRASGKTKHNNRCCFYVPHRVFLKGLCPFWPFRMGGSGGKPIRRGFPSGAPLLTKCPAGIPCVRKVSRRHSDEPPAPAGTTCFPVAGKETKAALEGPPAEGTHTPAPCAVTPDFLLQALQQKALRRALGDESIPAPAAAGALNQCFLKTTPYHLATADCVKTFGRTRRIRRLCGHRGSVKKIQEG